MLFRKNREKMVGENLREGSMEVAFELWIEQNYLSRLQRKFPPLSREAKTFQNLASEEQVWKKFSFWRISVKESRGQPPSGTLEQAVKNGNFL